MLYIFLFNFNNRLLYIDQIDSHPLWTLCNTIYLIFICINLIHERVISLYLTLYDFKPKIIKHRASQQYKKRKEAALKLKQNSKNIATKSYWIKLFNQQNQQHIMYGLIYSI